jgi:hypothetical protein
MQRRQASPPPPHLLLRGCRGHPGFRAPRPLADTRVALPALRDAPAVRDFCVPQFMWEALYNTAHVVALPLILYRHGIRGAVKRAFLPPPTRSFLTFIFVTDLLQWCAAAAVNVRWALDDGARGAVSFEEVLLVDSALLMRGLVIGIKYGYYSREEYARMDQAVAQLGHGADGHAGSDMVVLSWAHLPTVKTAFVPAVAALWRGKRTQPRFEFDTPALAERAARVAGTASGGLELVIATGAESVPQESQGSSVPAAAVLWGILHEAYVRRPHFGGSVQREKIAFHALNALALSCTVVLPVAWHAAAADGKFSRGPVAIACAVCTYLFNLTVFRALLELLYAGAVDAHRCGAVCVVPRGLRCVHFILACPPRRTAQEGAVRGSARVHV